MSAARKPPLALYQFESVHGFRAQTKTCTYEVGEEIIQISLVLLSAINKILRLYLNGFFFFFFFFFLVVLFAAMPFSFIQIDSQLLMNEIKLFPSISLSKKNKQNTDSSVSLEYCKLKIISFCVTLF